MIHNPCCRLSVFNSVLLDTSAHLIPPRGTFLIIREINLLIRFVILKNILNIFFFLAKNGKFTLTHKDKISMNYYFNKHSRREKSKHSSLTPHSPTADCTKL